MKKLVAAACALAAGIVLADAEAPSVSSANIVGYTEVTLTQEYTILGLNYTAVNGAALSIQEAFPYVEGMTKGNSISTADQIQIRDASGAYTTYYLSNGKNARGNTVAGLEGKWALMGKYVPTDATLPVGTGFWYVRKDTSSPLTLKIAGGVSLLASNNLGIDGAYSLIANPYPTDLQLNDCVPYVAGMTKGNSISTADQIQVRDANGNYTTYYLSNGKNARGNTVDGLEGKWALMGKYVPTDATIPAGSGFWYVRKADNNVEIQIVRPFRLE